MKEILEQIEEILPNLLHIQRLYQSNILKQIADYNNTKSNFGELESSESIFIIYEKMSENFRQENKYCYDILNQLRKQLKETI
jgi:hypothetical protein